jgi:hypothetical protein
MIRYMCSTYSSSSAFYGQAYSPVWIKKWLLEVLILLENWQDSSDRQLACHNAWTVQYRKICTTHPCFEWDLNPWSQCSRIPRLYLRSCSHCDWHLLPIVILILHIRGTRHSISHLVRDVSTHYVWISLRFMKTGNVLKIESSKFIT